MRWWRICLAMGLVWAGKIPGSSKWQPTPVLLPGKSHGQRSLAGCSPGGLRVRHVWAQHNSNSLTKRTGICEKQWDQESSNFFFSSVQFSRSVVSYFATPWIAARQTSLSITNSRSSLRLMPVESMMPSSHLILCPPLLLLPPIPPSIRVFSNESTLRMR